MEHTLPFDLKRMLIRVYVKIAKYVKAKNINECLLNTITRFITMPNVQPTIQKIVMVIIRRYAVWKSACHRIIIRTDVPWNAAIIHMPKNVTVSARTMIRPKAAPPKVWALFVSAATKKVRTGVCANNI